MVEALAGRICARWMRSTRHMCKTMSLDDVKWRVFGMSIARSAKDMEEMRWHGQSTVEPLPFLQAQCVVETPRQCAGGCWTSRKISNDTKVVQYGGKSLHSIRGLHQNIFDGRLKASHRNRSLQWRQGDGKFDMLQKEIASRLCDRLYEVRREFRRVLILGGASLSIISQLSAQLRKQENKNKNGQKEQLCFVLCDTDGAMLESCKRLCQSLDIDVEVNLIHDLEERGIGLLPKFESQDSSMSDSNSDTNKVDLIVACLSLHWLNNIVSVLRKAHKCLRSDGLFLACMYGEETLHELRISCSIAESERQGGVHSQRVSPMAQIRDAGSLLSSSGFTLPAVDVDTITMQYPTPWHLIDHLRAMGESSAASKGATRIRLDTAIAAGAVYQELFGDINDGIPATYQIIYLTGWHPHSSQQKPSKRGSATVSMHEISKLQTTDLPNFQPLEELEDDIDESSKHE